MLIEASVKHSVRQVCAKEGVTSLKPLLQHTHTLTHLPPPHSCNCRWILSWGLKGQRTYSDQWRCKSRWDGRVCRGNKYNRIIRMDEWKDQTSRLKTTAKPSAPPAGSLLQLQLKKKRKEKFLATIVPTAKTWLAKGEKILFFATQTAP